MLQEGFLIYRQGSEATNLGSGQLNLSQRMFVCLCVTLRNARSTSFSTRA